MAKIDDWSEFHSAQRRAWFTGLWCWFLFLIVAILFQKYILDSPNRFVACYMLTVLSPMLLAAHFNAFDDVVPISDGTDLVERIEQLDPGFWIAFFVSGAFFLLIAVSWMFVVQYVASLIFATIAILTHSLVGILNTLKGQITNSKTLKNRHLTIQSP